MGSLSWSNVHMFNLIRQMLKIAEVGLGCALSGILVNQ